jgi:hypothetical protein
MNCDWDANPRWSGTYDEGENRVKCGLAKATRSEPSQ